jgi:hypothetical protein
MRARMQTATALRDAGPCPIATLPSRYGRAAPSEHVDHLPDNGAAPVSFRASPRGRSFRGNSLRRSPRWSLRRSPKWALEISEYDIATLV